MNYTFDNYKTKYSPLQLYTSPQQVSFFSPTKHELKKPIGYTNIRMRATQAKSDQKINAEYFGEFS